MRVGMQPTSVRLAQYKRNDHDRTRARIPADRAPAGASHPLTWCKPARRRELCNGLRAACGLRRGQAGHPSLHDRGRPFRCWHHSRLTRPSRVRAWKRGPRSQPSSLNDRGLLPFPGIPAPGLSRHGGTGARDPAKEGRRSRDCHLDRDKVNEPFKDPNAATRSGIRGRVV